MGKTRANHYQSSPLLNYLLSAATESASTLESNPTFGLSDADLADEETVNAAFGGRKPTKDEAKDASNKVPYKTEGGFKKFMGNKSEEENAKYLVGQKEADAALGRQIRLSAQQNADRLASDKARTDYDLSLLPKTESIKGNARVLSANNLLSTDSTDPAASTLRRNFGSQQDWMEQENINKKQQFLGQAPRSMEAGQYAQDASIANNRFLATNNDQTRVAMENNPNVTSALYARKPEDAQLEADKAQSIIKQNSYLHDGSKWLNPETNELIDLGGQEAVTKHKPSLIAGMEGEPYTSYSTRPMSRNTIDKNGRPVAGKIPQAANAGGYGEAPSIEVPNSPSWGVTQQARPSYMGEFSRPEELPPGIMDAISNRANDDLTRQQEEYQQAQQIQRLLKQFRSNRTY